MGHSKKKIRKTFVPAKIAKSETVDDILTRDDVNQAISELLEDRANLTQVLIIGRTRDDMFVTYDSNLDPGDFLLLVESAKDFFLKDYWDDG